MTEHAMRNTTPPAADLFEIIRTTRSVRRIKSAGIPKWGGHPPTATRTTRWPVTPRGLGRGTGLLGENPARGDGRGECGRPPSPTATRKGKAVPHPSVPRPTRGKPGPAGRGCENWKSEAKHKDAFLTPAGRYIDLKK
jgi:hypothetical protein